MRSRVFHIFDQIENGAARRLRQNLTYQDRYITRTKTGVDKSKSKV